jgi:hypothetical protein
MNTNSSLTNAPEEISQTFKDLLATFIQEPFALSNGFEDLNFEEIGLILEEPFGDEQTLTDSYNSCKSTYCLMLIELELNGYEYLPVSFKEKTLKQLADQNIAPRVEVETSAPEKALEIVTERNLNLGNEETTNLNPILELAPPIPEETQEEPTNPANEYFELANFFANKQITPEIKISDRTMQRIMIQFAISGCEISGFNKLRDVLSSFWPNRIEAINHFIQTDSFKFTDSTNSIFERHEKQHGEWLYEGKFPRVATLHCLKYLSVIQSVERLHPSVFELGCFFYFFGALSNEIPSSINPIRDFAQLSSEQFIETAFRLFRLDRMKANANNFNHPLSEGQDQIVREEVSRIMCLLGEWPSEQQERAVA